MLNNEFCFLKEPVGSVAPKINTGENIQVIRGNIGENVDILCPAQAFPKPVFRYAFRLNFIYGYSPLFWSALTRFLNFVL